MGRAMEEQNSWQIIPFPDDRLSFSIDTQAHTSTHTQTHTDRHFTLLYSAFHDADIFPQRQSHSSVCIVVNGSTEGRRLHKRQGGHTKTWDSSVHRSLLFPLDFYCWNYLYPTSTSVRNLNSIFSGLPPREEMEKETVNCLTQHQQKKVDHSLNTILKSSARQLCVGRQMSSLFVSAPYYFCCHHIVLLPNRRLLDLIVV